MFVNLKHSYTHLIYSRHVFIIIIRVKSTDMFRGKEKERLVWCVRVSAQVGISINPGRMETHLFVLWTGETIKIGFFSHLQRKQCSASRSISSDTQSHRTEQKKHFHSSDTLIYPSLSFCFIRSERKKKTQQI